MFASFVMTQFQAAVSKAGDGAGDSDDDPATVKAAEGLLGRTLDKSEKPTAGEAVHYAFGAFLGALYGAVAVREPIITTGFGMPFGAAVAAIADEALVPAAGLSNPPWETPPSTHAYSFGSHLVFGAALEAARRMLMPGGRRS